MTPNALIAQIGAEFQRAADPQRAVSMSAYMRNQFPYFGIPTPQCRVIVRAMTKGLPAPTPVELKRIAVETWKKPQREFQYFGAGYAIKHAAACPPEFLSVFEMMITTKSWWDTVDALAVHGAGKMVRTHPDLVCVMDEWIDSHNFWLARTAILHQLSFKTKTDERRLFDYCRRRAGDSEFFIRKAIGWVLREYSKTNPRAVRQFVAKNEKKLSGLSKREALRRISI